MEAYNGKCSPIFRVLFVMNKMHDFLTLNLQTLQLLFGVHKGVSIYFKEPLFHIIEQIQL